VVAPRHQRGLPATIPRREHGEWKVVRRHANWVDVPSGRLEQDQRPIDPVLVSEGVGVGG